MKPAAKIRVSILDDHQSIVDGYLYRLSSIPEISVVGVASFGEELEPMLKEHPTDVLLLDVTVPTSPQNANPYPILYLIPKLLQVYPTLFILVISMHNQYTLVKAVMEAGASGYILKDDQASIRQLGSVITSIAAGGIYLSQAVHQKLLRRQSGELGPLLTTRQQEVLSLCAAYPDLTTYEIAARLCVANSTVRNLLSSAYLRLNVRNRSAAVARCRQLGLLIPMKPEAKT